MDNTKNIFLKTNGNALKILGTLICAPFNDASLKGAHISVPSIFKAFPLVLRKIFFVLSKFVIYAFLILLAYYGYKVLTLIGGETLVTLEWVPQIFVQSVIPVASCLFILSETLRIPEDYKNLVLQTTNIEQTGDI